MDASILEFGRRRSDGATRSTGDVQFGGAQQAVDRARPLARSPAQALQRDQSAQGSYPGSGNGPFQGGSKPRAGRFSGAYPAQILKQVYCGPNVRQLGFIFSL